MWTDLLAQAVYVLSDLEAAEENTLQGELTRRESKTEEDKEE